MAYLLLQTPSAAQAAPPAPIPLTPLPASARRPRPDYEIGRSIAGNLVYSGRFTEAGVKSLRSQILAGELVSIGGDDGGSVALGQEIARIVNDVGGTLQAGGNLHGCYDACAAMATAADRFVVPEGQTVLFTRASLTQVDNEPARALAACIPAEVPDRMLVWFAPEVIAGVGLPGVQIEWTLSTSARHSYERLVAGRRVAWIDVCRQATSADGSPL